MGDHNNQYGLPELRQLLAGRSNLEGTQQAIFDPFFVQTRNLAPPPPPPPSLHHEQINSHYDSSNISNINNVLPTNNNNNYLAKLDHHHYYCTNTTATTTTTTSKTSAATPDGGVELESSSSGWNNNNNISNYNVGFGSGNCNSFSPGGGGNNSCTSRWPRQETLTLLEIRSRLDPRFKEANQKGPLWDEVSRILGEEFGYQRSGKKCREKFENLYKYYKKTKEGKAGRQDGKHYRFFRQLEAIYGGDTSHHQSSSPLVLPTNDTFVNYHQNPINNNIKEISTTTGHHDQSLSSFTNTNTTSELETSSSEENNVDDDLSAIAYMMDRSKGKKAKGVANEGQSCEKGRGGKRGWKVKVKDYVELRMGKMMETQEFWMEKVLKGVEDREVERTYRQEEWMKQVEDRMDREHGSWSKERARMEARDAAFVDALKIHAGNNSTIINKALMKVNLPLSIEQMAIASHRDHYHQRVISSSTTRWSEPEVLSLIQLRTSMEPRFRENGSSQEALWEEVAAKMVGWGCDRSPEECMEKWESMNFYFSMSSSSISESNYEKWKQDFMRVSRSKEEAKEIGSERIINNSNNSNSNYNNNMVSSQLGYMSSQVQVGGSFYHGQGVNFWDKNDLKLGNEESQFM